MHSVFHFKFSKFVGQENGQSEHIVQHEFVLLYSLF